MGVGLSAGVWAVGEGKRGGWAGRGKGGKMGPQERWVRVGLPEVGPGRGFGFLVLGLGWVLFSFSILSLKQINNV